jgi:hypothetical protein
MIDVVKKTIEAAKAERDAAKKRLRKLQYGR